VKDTKKFLSQGSKYKKVSEMQKLYSTAFEVLSIKLAEFPECKSVIGKLKIFESILQGSLQQPIYLDRVILTLPCTKGDGMIHQEKKVCSLCFMKKHQESVASTDSEDQFYQYELLTCEKEIICFVDYCWERYDLKKVGEQFIQRVQLQQKWKN